MKSTRSTRSRSSTSGTPGRGTTTTLRPVDSTVSVTGGAGWVRGSYLVGSGAKLEVTPYKFEGFDPLDPIKTCDDDDDPSFFCW